MKIMMLNNKLLTTFLFLIVSLTNGLVHAIQTPESVTQEIRFLADQAATVELVWGVDGWQVLPEEQRPTGTRIVDGIMHTPMERKNDYFVAWIELSADSIVDFGFLITEMVDGAPVTIWVADRGDDYHRAVTPDEPIEIARPAMQFDQRVLSSIQWLILGIGIGLGMAIIFVRPMAHGGAALYQEMAIDLRITRSGVTIIVAILVMVNLIVLAGMWRFLRFFQNYNIPYEESSAWMRFGLVQFNLATENVVASWYISVLMLLVAVVCLLCFTADRQRFFEGRNRLLSYGWLILGLVFVVLSADEIGSWHETIGMLPIFGGGSIGWVRVLAIPIAIVAVFIASFAWFRLRRQPWSFWLVGLGLGLYIINPVFELMEMRLLGEQNHPESMRMHDLLIWIEEGTELFGTLCFLSAAALYASQSERIHIGFQMKASILLVSLLGLLFMLGLYTTRILLGSIERGDTGIAENWFPAMLAMIVCLVSVHVATISERSRYFFYGIAIFAVILSIYYAINLRGWLVELDTIRLLTHGILLLMVIPVALGLIQEIDSWWYRLVVALWLNLFTFTLFSEPVLVYWSDIAITIVPLLLLLPHLKQRSFGDTNAAVQRVIS